MGLSRYGLYPFLLALVVISGQVLYEGIRAPIYDEFIYLRLADDLNIHNTLTSAGLDEQAKQGEPGRFFTPIYPAFISLVSQVDTNLQTAVHCFAQKLKSCKSAGFSLLVTLQVIMAAISGLVIFLLAQSLSGSLFVAWSSVIVVLATGELGYYARHYLTENIAFFGFYCFLLFAVLSYQKQNIRYVFLAGTMLGVTILARPSYVYLAYMMAPFIGFAMLSCHRSQYSRAFSYGGLFAVGVLLVMAPWLMRNYFYFGDMALTQGYGSYILVQRLAYNFMTWPEFFVSFIYWLPSFGDDLAKTLFAAEHYQRLGFFHKEVETFFELGNGAFRDETIKAAGGVENHFSYLFQTYLIGDFFKHVAVTIPLSLRGLWVGGYISLVGFGLLLPVFLQMKRRSQGAAFALFVLPPLFMAGLHGFVSVNVVRYNTPMIAIYAFTFSYFLFHVLKMLNLNFLPNKVLARSL